LVLIDVNRPWRKVKVTEHRAASDFAECMHLKLEAALL
jgi:hypothetical protein